LTVLSQRHVAINSAHVVCGALVLATSLVLTLRAWRVKFAASVSAGIGQARRGVAASAETPGAVKPSGARA
jgi:hypothetical protein